MTWKAWVSTGLALVVMAVSLWQLQAARDDVRLTQRQVGATPVTVVLPQGAADERPVVIAHGFAGSRQLMQAYALTLARAGHPVVAFDFLGHGSHPDAMPLGTATQALVDQTAQMVTFAEGLGDGPVALLGHSMAGDVIVRAAIADDRVGPVIGVSIFSAEITGEAPRDMLLIAGQGEVRLRDAALRYLRMVDPGAQMGQTVRDRDVRRGAVVAPWVEHVSVLYSPTALRQARAWLGGGAGPVAATGGWIALLLAAIVALFRPIARAFPHGQAPGRLPLRTFLTAVIGSALVAPLIAVTARPDFLPVLIADYLALHLVVQGAVALALVAWARPGLGARSPWVAVAILVWGLVVFGFALDRYVASFMPVAPRLPIIAAVAVGAVPFMIADALLCEAGRAPFWRRALVRGAFLASLAGAIALDPERLFFLALIFPVIILFFAVFGMMGGWAGRRTGAAMPIGAALGLIFAWAIGVTFPMVTA